MVKKIWRDGAPAKTPKKMNNLYKELADTKAFLELIAMILKVDLDSVTVRKLRDVSRRLDRKEKKWKRRSAG